MKITIKGKRRSGATFSDKHDISDEDYKVLDYMLSWDRKMLNEVIDYATQKIVEKSSSKNTPK